MENNKTDVREKILIAARSLFSNRGVEHVSMRKIAECIGYSPTTIYLYFKDKSELLNTLVLDYYQNLISRSIPIMATMSRDPFEALRQYSLLFVHLGLENPDYYRLMTALFHEKHLQSQGNQQGYKVYGDMLILVKACLQNGDIEETAPEMIVQSLWSLLFGLTSLLTSRPEFDWTEQSRLIEFTINTYLEGLKR